MCNIWVLSGEERKAWQNKTGVSNSWNFSKYYKNNKHTDSESLWAPGIWKMNKNTLMNIIFKLFKYCDKEKILKATREKEEK